MSEEVDIIVENQFIMEKVKKLACLLFVSVLNN